MYATHRGGGACPRTGRVGVVVDGSRAGGQTATDDQGSVAGGPGMDLAKVEALAAAEAKWFRDGRPRSMEATSRAAGTMPRGVPVSWMDEQPSQDALIVAEALAQRYGMAKWQFTLSATQANTEVVRIARVRTGRQKVVVFDGKYHGHLDPTLGVVDDGRVRPEYTGLPAEVTANLRIVPFNDLDAVERALAPGDVALLLTEPAMTNAGFLLPD